MTPKQMKEVQRIEAAVCQHFDVDLKALKSQQRHKQVSDARYTAIYLADSLGLTRNELMGLYNRSHCLYYKAIEAVNNKLSYDNIFAYTFKQIKDELNDCQHEFVIYKNHEHGLISVCKKCKEVKWHHKNKLKY